MKNVVKRIISTSDDRSIGLVALWIFTRIALMTHCYGKVFGNPGRFVAGVEKIGFPFPTFFAFAALFSEFFGALLLCCGFLTAFGLFLLDAPRVLLHSSYTEAIRSHKKNRHCSIFLSPSFL